MAKTESLQLRKRITAILLMATVLLTSVVSVAAYSRTEAVIYDGSEKTEISSASVFTDQILSAADITLGENDEIIRNDENGIVSIKILRAFEVKVNDHGEVKTVEMAQGTVANAIEKAQVTVSENDMVSPAFDTELSENTEITVAATCDVTVTADGETKSCTVLQTDVKSALENAGYTLSGEDIVNTELSSQVLSGMNIVIKRVTSKEVKETQSIDFKSVEKKTDDLYKGKTKVKTEGVKGEKTITKKETYIDGKLVKTEKVSEQVTKEPVNEVTLVGTKVNTSGRVSEDEAEGSFIDLDGNKVYYSSKIVGTATAYNESEGSLTATGVPVYYGGVAVDPSIIPYGSKLYIASNDGAYVYGYATAVDTGGAMLSGAALIDLFYPSESQCVEFGRRSVTVYIL